MEGYFNLFGFQQPAGHIIRQSQPKPKKKVPSVQIYRSNEGVSPAPS